MGLPISVAFADSGFDVIAYDISKEIVDSINRGESKIKEPLLPEKLKTAVDNNKLVGTNNPGFAIKNSDVIIVIVPLGLDKTRHPDMSIVQNASETISKYLKKGHIVVFETTFPIGTTRNFVKPILEKSGLKAGTDFGLSYSPERVMSGEFFKRMSAWPKIVGSLSRKTSEELKLIYEKVYPSGVTIVDNPETAEMIKIASSLYRDVNIAFSNEIAKICDEYNIDVLKVVESVNEVPEKRMLYPGIGVGGHCIPVYPYFVINHVKSQIPVIENSRKTNESMPEYAMNLLEIELKKRNDKLEGKKVLILGLAFRPWVKETYFSPSLDLIPLLKSKNCVIKVYDPLYNSEEICRITGLGSGEFDSLVKESDAIIISTGYEEFKKVDELKKDSCIIIDGRNMTKNKGIGR